MWKCVAWLHTETITHKTPQSLPALEFSVPFIDSIFRFDFISWYRTAMGGVRGKYRHLQSVSHVCLRRDKRCLVLVKSEGDPEYLQREREGKQERPLGHCPVEGQTLEWERERKQACMRKQVSYKSESNIGKQGGENSHWVLRAALVTPAVLCADSKQRMSPTGTFSPVTVPVHHWLQMLKKNQR